MDLDRKLANSDVLTPQWNRPCSYCGEVLSGVWPDGETDEVTLKKCVYCGEGPITVGR